MKQEATETVDYLTSEETVEEFFPVADLSLTDEQLDDIKGGPGSGGYGSGGVLMNHNETTMEDEEAEADSLTDLPVASEEQIVGGGMPNIKHPDLTK